MLLLLYQNWKMLSSKKAKQKEEEAKLQAKRLAHFQERVEHLENVINTSPLVFFLLKSNSDNPLLVFKELFTDPPYNVNDDLIKVLPFLGSQPNPKDSFTVIFLMMMNKLRLDDVKTLLTKVSDKEAYIMMKYIYMSWKSIASGLQKFDKYCRSDILLKTHTLLVQKLGQCVVGRLLCDPLALQRTFI
eukprot:TRINITY_DN105158_c0_g1_i1.p6 TRINITY_DN105158_c0_g1~~TRINITY_DN105158_c0_g1_i1.p6  ORF type:complete len:188 (+),score=14.84 TRINITY_DN105158_c0_g1_i1:2886-3449(+)